MNTNTPCPPYPEVEPVKIVAAKPFNTKTAETRPSEATYHQPGRPHIACSTDAAASPVSHGDYVDHVYASPVTTLSDESMHNHLGNGTPPESPARQGSLNARAAAERIGRLSLDHGHDQDHGGGLQPERGRGPSPTTASKRSASSELQRPDHEHAKLRQTHRSVEATAPGVLRRIPHERYHPTPTATHTPRQMVEPRTGVRPFVQSHNRITKAPRGDSGYESLRADSIPRPSPSAFVSKIPAAIAGRPADVVIHKHKAIDLLSTKKRYPGLILQPDSSPISQDQLAAEVKGIYAGLVMVEAKCINIDAAQAADPNSQLSPEQWQALIALHRTLLYEHHDFLMATQHPSATPALRVLATKYSMPARMWKHGIHAFLEVLRHRRPASQDYMLAFIYLAYQMMSLLFETVSSFTDTWIECLGDLARYRMAIEEEKEEHATWGGVAARWYTMASDRHPAIGRLYHHLGILERPSLRKLCYYAKSLTCVIPFPNARDSLSTLCGPIVQDEQTFQSSSQSAEARIVTFHALVYHKSEYSVINTVGSDALNLLRKQPTKLRDFGAYLAITNIATLFELGSPTNILFQQYTTAINQAMQSTRPSVSTESCIFPTVSPDTASSTYLDFSRNFWLDTLDLVLKNYNGSLLRDSLAYVHVMLVCLHSFHSLRTRLTDHTSELLLESGRLPLNALALYLNALAQLEHVKPRILEYARQGIFLAPEGKEDSRPLSEDYLIRGLIWGQFYFCPGWFDGQAEDDGRTIETEVTRKARAERVLWLGLYLAFHTEFLHYDVLRKVFSAANVNISSTKDSTATQPADPEVADNEMERCSDAPVQGSRSSAAPSSGANSEDGFVHVKVPKAETPQPMPEPTPQQSWAKIAAQPAACRTPPMKRRQDIGNAVKVADEDEMLWSGEGEYAV